MKHIKSMKNVTATSSSTSHLTVTLINRLTAHTISKVKVLAVGFFLVSVAAQNALSQYVPLPSRDDYIFELRKKYPHLLRTWDTIVPDKYKRIDWIGNLNGTTGIVYVTYLSGQPFFIGYVCQPHNCGGNSVYFLIGVNSPEAYGMLDSSSLNVGAYFGSPPNDAKRIMQYFAAGIDVKQNDPFLKRISEALNKQPSAPNTGQNSLPPTQGTSKACERFPNLC